MQLLHCLLHFAMTRVAIVLLGPTTDFASHTGSTQKLHPQWLIWKQAYGSEYSHTSSVLPRNPESTGALTLSNFSVCKHSTIDKT